ncbi:hypothetical protein D9M70_517620 [compost metagenome]
MKATTPEPTLPLDQSRHAMRRLPGEQRAFAQALAVRAPAHRPANARWPVFPPRASSCLTLLVRT